MRKIWNKGHRIRASDKHLVYHFSIGTLLFVFVAVLLLLNMKQLMRTDWENFSLLENSLTLSPYNFITILIATGVCALVAFLYYRFCYDSFKKLLHCQKLARMILENKWYEADTVQDSGFFTDLQSRSREKIVWFPKIYYQMEKGLLHIRCEITLGKYQDQLLRLEDKLESGLYCELTDKTLLELKGRGCRQFESYLVAQQRSWYDFLMEALIDGGVMKRIDLAINDHTGILDIPELAEKCRKREYIGKSRSYKFYQSGELIKHREDDREYMGRTLYLGSLKSDVYFCIYEKDYEQYVKLGTPLEEADIINRFEIRLRNERAYYAVRDLLTYYDAEQTAFSIINQYVRFVDEEPDKRKNDWKLNDRWAWFIGDNRQSLKLTTKPEPYTLDRTLRWVQRQVAPTLKMLKKIDKGNGTDYMETIEQQAKLTEKHEMIIKQQTTPAKDLVES